MKTKIVSFSWPFHNFLIQVGFIVMLNHIIQSVRIAHLIRMHWYFVESLLFDRKDIALKPWQPTSTGITLQDQPLLCIWLFPWLTQKLPSQGTVNSTRCTCLQESDQITISRRSFVTTVWESFKEIGQHLPFLGSFQPDFTLRLYTTSQTTILFKSWLHLSVHHVFPVKYWTWQQIINVLQVRAEIASV